MSLAKTDIAKIAHLARLSLSDDDIPGYADELSRILTLVEQMNRVDTEGVRPLAHPLEAVQRLRSDRVTETDQRATFQSVAPLAKNGLYLVPKVIE
jgi:aspartyl-tRNA(Asn)/glutamyl-tRNA(Gln) amidotransferase subunit C